MSTNYGLGDFHSCFSLDWSYDLHNSCLSNFVATLCPFLLGSGPFTLPLPCLETYIKHTESLKCPDCHHCHGTFAAPFFIPSPLNIDTSLD